MPDRTSVKKTVYVGTTIKKQRSKTTLKKQRSKTTIKKQHSKNNTQKKTLKKQHSKNNTQKTTLKKQHSKNNTQKTTLKKQHSKNNAQKNNAQKDKQKVRICQKERKFRSSIRTRSTRSPPEKSLNGRLPSSRNLSTIRSMPVRIISGSSWRIPESA